MEVGSIFLHLVLWEIEIVYVPWKKMKKNKLPKFLIRTFEIIFRVIYYAHNLHLQLLYSAINWCVKDFNIFVTPNEWQIHGVSLFKMTVKLYLAFDLHLKISDTNVNKFDLSPPR